jgi:hypothetical protein
MYTYTILSILALPFAVAGLVERDVCGLVSFTEQLRNSYTYTSEQFLAYRVELIYRRPM